LQALRLPRLRRDPGAVAVHRADGTGV